MSASLAHVTDMTNTVAFALNGVEITVGHALSNFYRIPLDKVEAKIAGKSVRIVNRGVVTDLTTPLAANDTVTIYENEVAVGGVKGAESRRVA